MTPLNQLAKLADQILQDPVLLRRLSDQVYALLQSDLRHQHDRLLCNSKRYP
jgi:hypothetical protein